MNRGRYRLRARQAGFVDVLPPVLLLLIFGVGAFFVVAFILSLLAPFRIFKQGKHRFPAVLAILAIWWSVVYLPDIRRSVRAAERYEAIEACKKDLPAIPDQVKVDSIAVEPGLRQLRDLKKSLGERQLRFVELKAGSFPAHRNARDQIRAVAAWDNDNLLVEAVPSSAAYLRLSLSRWGDPRCKTDRYLGVDLRELGSTSPFSPDACLAVLPVARSEASHVLKILSGSGDSRFSRWAVVDARSGLVAASLTTNDNPEAPIRQRGGSIDEGKEVKRGWVSCRTPYWSLVTLLESDGGPKPLLALSLRTVGAADPLGAVVREDDWPEWVVKEVPVPNWSTKQFERVRHPGTYGPYWTEAFRYAEEHGWAVAGGRLIDLSRGELVELGRLEGNFGGGYTVASRDGFVFVSNGSLFGRRVPVVRYSLAGEILWRGLLRSATESDRDGIGRFNPVGVEWAGTELTVYGFRRNPLRRESDAVALKFDMSIVNAGPENHGPKP